MLQVGANQGGRDVKPPMNLGVVSIWDLGVLMVRLSSFDDLILCIRGSTFIPKH